MPDGTLSRKEAEEIIRRINTIASARGIAGVRPAELETWLKSLPDAQVISLATSYLETPPAFIAQAAGSADLSTQRIVIAPAKTVERLYPASRTIVQPVEQRMLGRPGTTTPLPPQPARAYAPPTASVATTLGGFSPAAGQLMGLPEEPPKVTIQDAKWPMPPEVTTRQDFVSYRAEIYEALEDWYAANPDPDPQSAELMEFRAQRLVEAAESDWKVLQGGGVGGGEGVALGYAQLGEQRRQFDIQQQLAVEQEKRLLQDMLAQTQLQVGQLEQNARGATAQIMTQLAPNMLAPGTAFVPGFEPGGLAAGMGGAPIPTTQMTIPGMIQPTQQAGQAALAPLLQFLQSRQ